MPGLVPGACYDVPMEGYATELLESARIWLVWANEQTDQRQDSLEWWGKFAPEAIAHLADIENACLGKVGLVELRNALRREARQLDRIITQKIAPIIWARTPVLDPARNEIHQQGKEVLACLVRLLDWVAAHRS